MTVSRPIRSMHPRMEYPPEKRKKLNTCKPPNPPSKKLDRKRAKLNDRRNAHSLTLKSLPSNAQTSFRAPGSMKQGKG